MKTKVVLTVDTEPSIAGAYDDLRENPPLIHEPVWGDVAGRSEALGFIIRTLSRHGLTATFFVETVHTSHFSSQPMGRYVSALRDANQDIQLHLHPTWKNFQGSGLAGDGRISDHCHRIGEELLYRLIVEGADQIEAWTSRRPTGMRTGNFSTDRDTYKAMRRAGLRYASNICAALPAGTDPALDRHGGIHEIDGVVELPVTCFKDRSPIAFNRLRPMQVTSCSYREMKMLLNNLHTAGGRVAVIVTHPFEYIRGDDRRYRNLRPNKMVQRRLEKLCDFLARTTDRFETVTLDVAARTSPIEAPVLSSTPITALLRAAQNALNDRIV